MDLSSRTPKEPSSDQHQQPTAYNLQPRQPKRRTKVAMPDRGNDHQIYADDAECHREREAQAIERMDRCVDTNQRMPRYNE
ncbi:MAG TPA: hypothetical protein VNE38_06080 [Ktedonobacteraceae bacterium]|nr:hypothetical protein [Ktedonobacteraceae bacterium]